MKLHPLILPILFALSATPVRGAPPAPVPEAVRENLLSFDCGRTEVAWRDRRWQLLAGNVVLKDFGPREDEARHALRLVRELGLNARGTIGQPSPIVEYWLTDGRAPHGPMSGPRVLPFDVARLRVEQAGGQWCLCEGSRALFKFGHHQDDAKLAEAVIRKYGFHRLVIVGQAAPSMIVFLADDAGTTPVPLHVTSLRDTARKPTNPAGNALKPAAAHLGASPDQLVTSAVAPLRATARPAPGPRTSFAGGSIRTLPSGRQLGATPPPADVAKLADRVAFDCRQAAVHNANGDWQLVVGSHVLARFGDREAAARQALEVLQQMHLTEQMAVGAGPYFSYFLAAGRPPRGVPLGLSARAFQPECLVVRQLAGRWCICDQAEPLLRFGTAEPEAKQFLRLLQKERLDRLCVLGATAEEGMTLLMRSR